ncbi:transcription factor vestigial isoform X2 [Arctopsyche grandis]|uniref:transcription factor vestigial isoform X2 n=1 Tax=Arctopsyche grandis TaxID=121162 RepID=UPI00406D65C9
MGCPEVVYGAYYPYLYGRAAPSRAAATFASPFSPHQYDRFNVQSTQPLPQDVYGTSGGAGAGTGGGGSGGSVSSGGGASPAASPPRPHHRLRAKEEDLSLHGRTSAEAGGAEEDEDDGSCGAGGGGGGGSRAQYVSANCVVFTHYSGDVAAVVDEHFTRALGCDKSGSASTKDASPMSSRNFPASFWNSQYQPAPGAAPAVPELYADPYHAHAHAAHAAHPHDPWATHYQQYTAAAHHHRAVHEYHHHHNTMAQYGGLLLPTRLPHHAQYKPPVDWSASHTSRLHEQATSAHHGHTHALETAAYSSYPTMAGLEAQVQESSKDLYWF